jgi:uncharacterized protein (TIGR03086 family)
MRGPINRPAPKARDVVDHVANNYLRISSALSGQTLPSIAADDDIVTGWNRAKSSLLDALTLDLTKEISGPFGPMPAVDLLGRFVANDTLVHTWDLARSVGGNERLPAEVVAGALEGLKPLDAMIRRPGVFGDKVEVDESADLQTQFLAFVGRSA